MSSAPQTVAISELPLAAPAGAKQPKPARARRPRRSPTETSFIARYWWIFLILITAFGGFIRFYWIEYPTLWNDDVHTFRRVGGTFQDMLDIIQSDGFAPLTFELFWWIGHRVLPDTTYLTPFMIRIVPASSGTLLIPAMYFLARQMSSKRASLLAAAFTACSAFMMVYSQNTRMYMPLFLSMTLCVGSLLWWLRTNLRIAWLCWIAAGLATGGSHAPGLLLMLLFPLFLLTQAGLNWKRAIAFVIGFAIIISGPVVFYFKFNQMTDRMDETELSGSGGMSWARPLLEGRTGPDLLCSVSTAYLYSWEWPADDYVEDDQPRFFPKPPPPTPPAPRTVAPATRPATPAQPPKLVLPASLKTMLERLPVGRSRPVYYAGSSADIRNTRGAFGAMLRGFNIHPGVFTGLTSAAVLVGVFAAIGMFPWPRRLRGQKLGDVSHEPFWRSTLWLIAWLAVPTYIFYCMQMADYVQPKHWVQAGWSWLPIDWWIILIAVVALAGLMMAWRYIPRFLAWYASLMALVLFVIAAWRSGLLGIFQKTDGASWWRPGSYHLVEQWWLVPRMFGASCASLFTRHEILIAGAVLLPALAWHSSAFTLRRRAIRTLQFLLALTAAYALCVLVNMAMHRWPPKGNVYIWNARYMAIIFPAIAVGLSVLIMRLPTRPLRYLAIAIILGTNLAQAWGRMFAGSEPRIDLIMADIVEASKPDSSVRTFVQGGDSTAHPAGGVPENLPGRYYASVLTHRLIRPHDFTTNPQAVRDTLKLSYSPYGGPSSVTSAARSSDVKKIIVWERMRERPDPKDIEKDDALAALGSGWEKASDQFYPVRYHWNWSDLYVSRRRAYIKVPPKPVAAPATQPGAGK